MKTEGNIVNKSELKCEDTSVEVANGLSAAESYETMEEQATGLDNLENDVSRLKEFLVLDEFNPDSDKDVNENSESDEEDSDDVPDEEVEAMLDEGLPEGYRGAPKKKECPYDQIQKIIMEDKGINHFEVLPLGWLIVNHNSGLPLYLHKISRVCTLARPYFLGPGSARKHEIPVTAIPCYNYRQALDEEERLANGDTLSSKSNISTVHELNKNDISDVNSDTKKAFKRPFDVMKNEMDLVENSDMKNIKKPKVELLPMNNLDSNSKEITTNGSQCPADKSVQEILKNSDEPSTAPNAKTECQNGDISINSASKTNTDVAVNTEKAFVNTELLKKLVNTENVEEERNALVALMPTAKVETAQENWKSQHLRHEEVTDYCKKLFKFKYIKIMRFKSWSERRKFTKTRQALQRPTLPDGTKLITFPIQADVANNPDGSQKSGAYTTFNKTAPKECLMNPNGKSYVCILHEYVQRALKKQPTYEYKEFENGATPYSATVSINSMKYGVGYGTSKRQAKSAAAKATIEILIPEMRDKIKQDNELNGTASRNTDQDLEFFDDIKIEDPRVYDFCAKTMEPSPHTVLQTCLARNFGIGDREIKYQMNTLKHQRNEFTMTVGKHSITVVCKNKREGKQRASQGILQALHPNITSWGSLLRLYGNRSVKSFKEKKQEEQEITLLQSRAAVNQPNYAILEKLRSEMSKLAHKDKAIAPIGTLLVREHLPEHSGSNLNNVDL